MLVCLIRVQNNERKIARTLKAMPFVDHFFVVDNNSTDGTLDIVAQYPHTIVHTEGLNGPRDFNLIYPLVLKMGADWGLWMDADEEWEKRAAAELPKLTQQDLIVGWRFPVCPFVIYKDFYRIDRGWAPFTMPGIQPLKLFRCQPQLYWEDPRSLELGLVKGLRGPIRDSGLRIKHWTGETQEEIERKLAFYKRYNPDKDYSHLRDDGLAVYKRWKE